MGLEKKFEIAIGRPKHIENKVVDSHEQLRDLNVEEAPHFLKLNDEVGRRKILDNAINKITLERENSTFSHDC